MRKNRLELTDNPMSVIMKMADGNPGAATVIMKMFTEGQKIDPDSALGVMGKLFQLDDYGIYGTDIYVLHNDICDEDIVKTFTILRAVQLGFFDRETLKDACSRQDYSGVDMIHVDDLYKQVKERLPNFNSNTVEP